MKSISCKMLHITCHSDSECNKFWCNNLENCLEKGLAIKIVINL